MYVIHAVDGRTIITQECIMENYDGLSYMYMVPI